MGQSGRASQGSLIARGRVADQIVSTPPGGVCLLVAPAGYGRRTALAQALSGGAAVVELPPHPVELEEWRSLLLAAGLHRDELDREPSTGWLVVLDVDPALHAPLLRDLVDLSRRRPAGRRLAVTSSSELAPAFHRARMSGLLVEVDRHDLALLPEEAANLLREMAPDLDEVAALEVVRLCAGWAGALVATASHHRGRSRAETLRWLRTRGAEQLLGPWLDTLAQESRELLLDTAILDQLHPELVDAVAGPGRGQRLSELAGAGSPLWVAASPTTQDGTWYDRHPLLTAVLLRHAAARPGEAVRHRRAAEWYLGHGVMSRELVHRLSAGDGERAAARFREHENELLETGRADVALQWYRTLPDAGRAEHLLREAWAYALSDRMVDARVTLDRLRLAVGSEPETPSQHLPQLRDLGAEADVLEAWLGERDGDLVRCLTSAGHARAAFGEAWSSNSHQMAPLLHARSALHLGDLDTAERVLATVRALPFLAATLGEGRRSATEAELAWAVGDVLRSRTWSSRYHRWLDDQDPDHARARAGGSIAGYLALAEAQRDDEAVAGLAHAVEHAAAVTRNATDEVLARSALAGLLGSRRQLRPALQQAAQARTIVLERSPSGGLLATVTAVETRLRLLAGDTVRAERLLRQLPPSSARQLLHLRLALQRGLPLASSLTREIVPSTPREEVSLRLLAAWSALGVARQRSEHELMRAADIGAEHGMTTLLCDAPDPVLELAARTASRHVHDPLILLVRTAQRMRSNSAIAATDSPATSGAALSLTRGELQLLALLPTRASNAQIGSELDISVNTVKTRLRRLYAKLDVHDRDQAVARARELGLLGTRGGPDR